MLSIHCINHRLALGAAQSLHSVQYLRKFNEMQEIQAILNDPVLKFKEPKDVQWLYTTRLLIQHGCVYRFGKGGNRTW